MTYLPNAQALSMGYARDRRRRRAEHRAAARSLRKQDPWRSSIIGSVITWHLVQARRP